jgi:hypothetical protein
MLYVFHGTDTIRVRTEGFKKAEEYAQESGVVETITSETCTKEILQNALGAASLFYQREVFVLETLSHTDEMFEVFLDMLPQLNDSPNVFVVIEEKLTAGVERTIKAHAAGVTSYARDARKEFNVFALTDALLLRDKKTLWLLLMEAWKEGKKSEEIIGTLMWQLKTIRLARLIGSAEETGLKPFVYDKARRSERKFSKEEIEAKAHSLVMLYHDGHSGKRNIDWALEKWVLTL